MNIRNLLVRVFDIVNRENVLIWKYYRPFSIFNYRNNEKNVFMADGCIGHGGMFDRLKGIITLYAISKIQQKEFKINFIYPFDLNSYLVPNTYNWQIDINDIIYSYPSSRPVIAYGEYINPKRLLKNRKKETHFYYGYDSLDIINKKYNTSFEWGELYNELFKPSKYLQQYIDFYKHNIGNNYIAIHTRFLNLLGDKTETDINPTIEPDKQEMLKQQCRDKIIEIRKSNVGCRILIATDSNIFIDYIKKEILDVYIIPGTVKHIDTAGKTNDAENIKVFLDYYLIGGAMCVYSIVGPNMWSSAFPEYAAKIGKTKFERQQL